MRIGIVCLVLGYVLSQFYRAFLAVLAPALAADLGTTEAVLADAVGIWFLAFAAMQIPVGWALDRVGPRRTAAVLLGFCSGGGALLFAAAQGPGAILLAMALIGIGCAPVLMSSYYIFARMYRPAVFGTLAGVVIGVGSLGNLGAALPLSLAAEAFGWRGTVAGLAVVTLAVAAAILVFVQDPPRVAPNPAAGSLGSVLRNPALWLILLMMLVVNVPGSGIRGLWIGPYFAQVHGLDSAAIGMVTLAMGLAMVAGSFAYGPLDRLFRTRKGVVLAGNLLMVACLLVLWYHAEAGVWAALVMIAGVGFFGMSFPVIMSHGRALFPPHLVGRGVTLLNLFGIGGVGLFQMVSGRVHAVALAGGATPAAAYGAVFGFFALVTLAGCAAYLFSADRTD
ncbi:MFS transporter [Ruixingdingia sedimenti]|uniref:MFS transporter n=1 Tax=Ruixingdingia sedimenti TaxID=3073604 RepID=A0ABU1F6D2_9RHOB|nr:MFS transporter [Xinfangfangia sp. LG-4]MDR5651999.1 MFS transporter [Xinfangfangia sp. LG-4]